MLKVLDLFSGIGGFSLGLERTGGFKTIQFCEIDPFCRKVLAKHWPDIPIHEDVRTMQFEEGQADVITGGFPCQDISVAGNLAGLDGERSGLWAELIRAIGDIRPKYAIIENSPNLLSGDDGRWFATLLQHLAAIRYDAEWHCISAAHIGAPHIRDRVWILAYPDGRWRWPLLTRRNDTNREDPDRAQANHLPRAISKQHIKRNMGTAAPADTNRRQQFDSGQAIRTGRETPVNVNQPSTFADAYGLRGSQPKGSILEFGRWSHNRAKEQWSETWPERLSAVSRMDDGLSRRVDKLGCDATGNAILPQFSEQFGYAILEAEKLK